MAWFAASCKLYQKLQKSMKDPDSKLWHEVVVALQNIYKDLNISDLPPSNKINQLIWQQKPLWTTNVKSTQQILKWLIFHTNHFHFFIEYFYQKQRGTDNLRCWITLMIERLINNCYMVFEKFHLIRETVIFCTGLTPGPIVSMAIDIEFTQWKPPNYRAMFWTIFCAIYLPNFYGLHRKTLTGMLGFVLVCGKQCIKNILSNQSEKQLQQRIISMNRFDEYSPITINAIRLSKMLKSWVDDNYGIEKYGRKLISRRLKNIEHNDSLMGDFYFFYGRRLKGMEYHDSLTGDFYFLYGKMSWTDKKYSISKDAFISAIYYSCSFAIMSLSLQYLSKICKYFGEYEIGLKCLKFAYKLCIIDSKTYILPSFAQRDYGKRKRLFIKKLNRMKCEYCGKKNWNQLRSCTGCMKVMYCNRKCQKKHWK
eukprot:377529_1